MKNSEKPLYKRLNELSLIIASNLREIDKEYLEEIIELIDDTRVNIYSEIFEESLSYFKKQKKMPDFDYINMHFPKLMKELEDEEPAWHYSFASEYLQLLKRDKLLQSIIKASAQDNLEEIDSIITANESMFSGEGEDELPTWDELWEKYKEIKNSKPPLKWGIRELDKMYNGLCYGTCNILAAPPGKFKTTTAISTTYVNLVDHKKCLYITLEDSWDVIYFNIATRESYEQDRMLNASNMKIGQLDEEDEDTLKEIIEKCKEKYSDCFRVACQEKWHDFTPAGMLRLIRKVKKEMNGLDLVVLDHASLTKYYRVRGISDPKEIINFYVRFLTNWSIALEDKFALLVAMQTNREGIKELEAGKTGSLTNLAEANEAERSASTVTLIYSGPNAVESNIINFYPKKNRRGTLTAKPIISFIEPGAYFVGEHSVEGDISLDDLMEDMTEEDSTKKRSKTDITEDKVIKKVAKPVFSRPQETEEKSIKKKTIVETSSEPEHKSGLVKRKIRKLKGAYKG